MVSNQEQPDISYVFPGFYRPDLFKLFFRFNVYPATLVVKGNDLINTVFTVFITVNNFD